MFDEIVRLYEQELQVPGNETCRLSCDARFKRPLLPWHVGDLYHTDERRLVIIGKPHREDEPTESRSAGTQDGRKTADRLFRTKNWPFWFYTKAILRTVYGSEEEGWRRMVLTTIVKCTNASKGRDSADTTSERMMNSCIGTLGVIRKELAILKPATVILYTGKDYDNWIPRLMWASRQKWRSLTNEAHEVDCDGVRLRWWEGELTGGPTHVRVLRVGHPQGKPVDAYVRMLSDWIGNPGVGAQKSAEEEISL